MPTYRQGRTYFLWGANDRGGCAGVLAVLFVLTMLLLPPLLLVVSESMRHDTYKALMEVLQDDIVELGGSNRIRAGEMVHATSDDITTTPGASDPELDITIPNALLLKRNTEYCQWQELQTEKCQTCTRGVRAKDGTIHEEEYSCNCIISYSYVKSWRSHRINSALFNQPGAHNNPMRDPLPPAQFVAPTATLHVRKNISEKEQSWWNRIFPPNRNAIQEITMDQYMIQNTKAPLRRVKWSPRGGPPRPGFFARMLPSWWPKDKSRYEPTATLENTSHSPAAEHHGFVYAGKGYFYSPYQESTSQALFKYFMEYMEGSLMDWQLGDLVKSCTAGDVRVFYQVADPSIVSVLGEVKLHKRDSLYLAPKTTSSGLQVGLVHAGLWSAEQMVHREDSDAWWTAVVFRIVMILWSIAACRLLGALVGRNVAGANIETRVFEVVSMFGVVAGSVWRLVWGTSIHNTTMTVTAMAVLFTCLKWYTPRANSPPGVRAVWCMLAMWARVPPSWRVESSYEKGTIKYE